MNASPSETARGGLSCDFEAIRTPRDAQDVVSSIFAVTVDLSSSLNFDASFSSPIVFFIE